jgi:nucleoredoxin
MAAELASLLGEKLQSKSGEVSTADALAGKSAIALYFSAHWCPPCRGFTPQLAEWYSTSLQAKGLEIVFVSSDKEEEGFKDYFGSMPWLALPFTDRDRKQSLSAKFKVSGIPSVVILDGSGKTITTDGRAAIAGDPTGEDMPWKPKSLQEILEGATLIGKDGSKSVDALKDQVYAFYFSAHWCPPCRGFTPQLAEWYTKDLKAKGLEVVFVSSDREEEAFKEYFGSMPWLALEYSDRKRKEQLSNLFGVRGIPSVVIIDKDGSVISKEGRAAIGGDPTGAEFPWYPKPVFNFKDGPGSLNESPTLVALCEACDASSKKAAEAALEPIAIKYKDEAKAKGEEDPAVAFGIATEAEGIAGQIRKMTGLAGAEEAKQAKLMLFDIPDNGGFYEGPEGEITTASISAFIEGYLAKTLERKQLS